MTTLKKAIALTAAAATPFAIAAFAAWSLGPAASGERDVPAAVVNLDEMLTTEGPDGGETTTSPPVYDHRSSTSEPLLWAVDAVVWAVGAGGDWRRRVDPIVTVRRVKS